MLTGDQSLQDLIKLLCTQYASSLPGSLCCQGTSWRESDKSQAFPLSHPVSSQKDCPPPNADPNGLRGNNEMFKRNYSGFAHVESFWDVNTEDLGSLGYFFAKETEFLSSVVTLKRGTMLESHCYVFLEQMCTAFKLKLDIWKSKSCLRGLLY